MKTLSVKQPWAYLMCLGIKDIENRTFPTKFRGRVLIHTGAKSALGPNIFTHEQWICLEENRMDFHVYHKNIVHSSIIGSVEIIDCVLNHSSVWAEQGKVWVFSKAKDNAIEKPIYNWVLKNPIMFAKPIQNVKGKLSFWDYEGINEPQSDGFVMACNCQLPIDEKDQVISMIDHFRCRYCGGVWYK